MDSAILEDIKARLQSRDGWVILELVNEEDKSREGSKINRENDSDEEDKNREGSRINRENNGKNKDDQGFSGIVLLLRRN